MKDSEIRSKVLSDHAGLREALAGIEVLAGRVLNRDEKQLSLLREEGTHFLDVLLTHLEWEDEHLGSALLSAGDRGEQLAEELSRDHAEQRDLMEHILRGLADEGRPALIIARNLLDLCSLLSDDIVDEEEMLLEVGLVEPDGLSA